MKQLIFCICLCFSSNLIAQNPYAEDIKAIYTDIYHASVKGDYDKVMDYSLPKIFTLVPRDKMKDVFKQMLSGNDDMKIAFGEMGIDSVATDILTTKEGVYGLLYAHTAMDMTVLKKDEGAADSSKLSLLSLMQLSFEEKYGSDNVKLNKETATFSIKIPKTMTVFFNSDPQKSKSAWKSIQFQPEKAALMAMMLDKEVVDWVVKISK